MICIVKCCTNDIAIKYTFLNQSNFMFLINCHVGPRCVIEIFGGVFVLSRCFLDFSVDVGVFVIGLRYISSFSSHFR